MIQANSPTGYDPKKFQSLVKPQAPGVQPVPGGVQPVTAPSPGYVTNASGDTVTKAGTVGIDGITRSYDYVEGRKNADPVSSFATSGGTWNPATRSTVAQDATGSWVPNDPNARATGDLDTMARQMAYMNEQRSAGNPNATADQMPANFVPKSLDPIAPITPAAAPTPSAATPATPSAGTPAPQPNRFAQITGIDPANDLRGQQIAPVGRDRMARTQDRFNSLKALTDARLKARDRAITQSAAAGGRLGSGMLRTDLGNAGLAAELELNDAGNALFGDALDRQIGDEANWRNELRGERDFQVGSDDRAYGRTRDQYLLGQDAMDRGFNRDMQRARFGYEGNPASAVANLANGQKATAAASSDGVMELLRSLGANAGRANGIGDTSGIGKGVADVIGKIDWSKLLGG